MKQTLATYRIVDSIAPDRIAEDLSSLGAAVRGSIRIVRSVYFDTFDWRLFAENKSLAVLSAENGEEIHFFDHGRQQTISRQTIEAAKGALPGGFASDLPAGDLRDSLEAVIEVRRLFPRLAMTSKQWPISVLDKEGKTILRLRLEQLRFRKPSGGGKSGSKGGKSASLGAQLTLLPVRGYGKPFMKAKRVLDRRYKRASKAAPPHVKGLKKIGTTPGAYSSKLRLDLAPEMAAGDAARLIHLTLLETMELNEEGTIKNLDSEFLHDFRVAVRRVRSALSQIDKGVLPGKVTAKAKKDFRWLGQQTNHMRDLDVYLIEYPKLQAVLPKPYKPNLKPFKDYLSKQSAKENKKIAALIKGRRYRGLRDHWRAFMSDPAALEDGEYAATPIKALADARIWKTYRRFMKEGEAIGKDAPAEALHELRISGKKLRYLIEFFQGLYPRKKVASLIKEQKALQNVLGEFQDAEIQSQAILRFGREMSDAGVAPIKTQMAMGMVAESILQLQDKAYLEFFDRFEDFSRPPIRKAFARLFKN